ncbi:MAG: exodeoxyribonuclease VII small subunit [Bacteroidaceae bacterium]|nr:exodeoxyribonuclease VII small subunit [Bacteroidaceae bacterium]
MKYNEALQELQLIVAELENNPNDIETLSEKLKRAQELIKICKDKLTKTDEDIKNLLKAETNS